MLTASSSRGFVPLPCLGYFFKAGFYSCVLMRAAGLPACLLTQNAPHTEQRYSGWGLRLPGVYKGIYILSQETLNPHQWTPMAETHFFRSPGRPQLPDLGWEHGFPARFPAALASPNGHQLQIAGGCSSLCQTRLGTIWRGLEIARRNPRTPRAARLLWEGEFSWLTTRCPPYPSARPAAPRQNAWGGLRRWGGELAKRSES